jgi:tyrosinase
MPANGSCIEKGPFANSEVRYTGWATRPHCLSRGFGRFPASHNFSGEAIAPMALQDVLKHDDFYDFVAALEVGPHDTIPYGVGGGLMLAAPNGKFLILNIPSYIFSAREC